MLKRAGICALTCLMLVGTDVAVAWSDSLDVRVACSDGSQRNGAVTVTLTLTSRESVVQTISKVAYGMHLGGLELAGPMAGNFSASIPPRGVLSVPQFSVTMPPDATVGTFVTFGFGFLGKVGAGPRKLLGGETCLVEVLP